jgi:iron complex transport system substrate-binding protein
MLLVPHDQNVPKGFDDALLVRTPLENVFYMYTTQVGFLDALEDESLLKSVAAVTIDEPEWTIPTIIEGLKTKRILYLPQSEGTAINVEPVIKLKPDMIFSGTINMGTGDIIGQFKAVGLPYTVTAEWMEDSNPAFIEWIKFIAAFYNKDEEADIIFEQKVKHLDNLIAMAKDIPQDDYPTVAYASFYNGIVWTQGSDSPTALEYKKAAGKYYISDLHNKGAVRIGMEEFVDKARDADILMYSSMITYVPNKKALLNENPFFAELKAYKNGNVYVLSRGYYMNSAKLDEKFADTIAIFHPELFPIRDLIFYEKLK